MSNTIWSSRLFLTIHLLSSWSNFSTLSFSFLFLLFLFFSFYFIYMDLDVDCGVPCLHFGWCYLLVFVFSHNIIITQAIISWQSTWVFFSGKRAFIAGIADDNGYGWAIAKSLAAAGAEILVGTWVPVCWFTFILTLVGLFVFNFWRKELLLMQALNIFETSLQRGKFDESRV